MNRTDGAKLERIVRCPTCGGDSVYSPKNEARPFCSVRCKNVDLGAWANEDFRVPDSVAPSDASDSNPLSH
ncbi:MAG: DNA gyrase inhibitor YacG [Burkholderiales bacterium]|nr:DNA gyrase inhibitor YacG [Burkholderiales bacterium]MBP7780238.1 DNA gyrase inhibitor YacG [Burkholderiaceae bacterium]